MVDGGAANLNHDTDQHDDCDIPSVPDRLLPVLETIQTITNDEVEVVLTALRNRDNELREERASCAIIGKRIAISDILPRYLDGLIGDIEDSDGDWVSVRLTEESTGRLRFCGQYDYDTGSELRYLLVGVPAGLCFTPTEFAVPA